MLFASFVVCFLRKSLQVIHSDSTFHRGKNILRLSNHKNFWLGKGARENFRAYYPVLYLQVYLYRDAVKLTDTTIVFQTKCTFSYRKAEKYEHLLHVVK